MLKHSLQTAARDLAGLADTIDRLMSSAGADSLPDKTGAELLLALHAAHRKLNKLGKEATDHCGGPLFNGDAPPDPAAARPRRGGRRGS
jgi:hypothetical protein